MSRNVRRGCGLPRMGKKHGKAFIYRPPCGSRRCTVCQPKVVARKMARLPEGPLYGVFIETGHFRNLSQQLAYQRSKGRPGDYLRIPVDESTLLIVSDAPVGEAIDPDTIEAAMMISESHWGSLTTSEGWRDQVERHEDPDFEDLGVVTSSLEWIEGKARREGIRVTETDERMTFETTHPDDLALLKEVAGVISDREYWERMTMLGRGRQRDWLQDFLDRLTG